MAQIVMRAPLRRLVPLLLPFTAALRCPLARRSDASLPHRSDAALTHRSDAALTHQMALGAVAGGLGDAGPADDGEDAKITIQRSANVLDHSVLLPGVVVERRRYTNATPCSYA